MSEDIVPSKDDIILMVDEMIKTFENLPQHALMTPISHYDHLSLLILLSAALKSFR